MINMLCNECSKRPLCSCLCPEAEAYVSQDEVSQKEMMLFDEDDAKSWPDPIEKSEYTPTERKLVHALLAGKTREEICQELEITRESLRKYIYRIRRKRGQKTT